MVEHTGIAARLSADEFAQSILEELSRLSQRRVPALRQMRRAWSKRLRGERGTTVRAAARKLVSSGDWGARMVAFELLVNHGDAFAGIKESWIRKLAGGLDSWGSVDLFGATIAGRAWQQGQISDDLILDWCRSPNRWHRRLALVCTVVLNSRARGAGDARRTLKICKLLIDDREDTIVKAMSWALRELSVSHPNAVRTFLLDHNERLAARVRREVSNKLTTGRKTKAG